MTPRLVLAILLLLGACATQPDAGAPETAGRVDLSRYSGTWFEIARFPTPFQDGANRRCVDVTASYTPLPDGTLEVVNRCRDAANAGKERIARGIARSASPDNDRLRVSFFWLFFGDYWVIAVDPDYRWAVAGAPGRDALWILSRTPVLPAGAYSVAIAEARRQGFNILRLVATPQRAATEVRSERFERAPRSRELSHEAGRG